MAENVLIVHGGGPTAVINSSLYGVIEEAKKIGKIDKVYAAIGGSEGILKARFLNLLEFPEEKLKLLLETPATAIGSSRYALEQEDYEAMVGIFKKHEIKYVLLNGGNGTMDTCGRIYEVCKDEDIRVVGIPKTIDNDIAITDHTPGFGSAAKYVASTVREIAVDASVYDNKKSVTIVEIMGRHAGWLTAASALARKFEGDNPVLIYLPEVAFDTERFIQDVSASLEKVSNVIVCISEGINDGKGTFICELASEVGVDTFGHKMLTGSGKYLENLIKDRLGVKVRSVELNVSQRCSSAMLSATDLQEAVDSGAYGVKCALHGESGKMIAFVRADGEEYKLSYEAKDVNEICNREKGVPAGWITKDGSDVSDEFIRYAKPLIQGEVQVPQQDGLPLFAYRK